MPVLQLELVGGFTINRLLEAPIRSIEGLGNRLDQNFDEVNFTKILMRSAGRAPGAPGPRGPGPGPGP
jgi:hypothetical protein